MGLNARLAIPTMTYQIIIIIGSNSELLTHLFSLLVVCSQIWLFQLFHLLMKTENYTVS